MNSEFTILRAEVIISLPTGDTFNVDIRQSVLQLSMYENLQKPYIDCDMLLQDDFGFRNNLRVRGTERFLIQIGTGNTEQPIISKSFFLSKINDVLPQNERSEIISMSLVEDHVVANTVKQISRSYTSNLETMIQSILQTDLGVELNVRKFGGTAQGVRKVLIPYMNPIEAIYWIRNRATTKTGAPIFVYSDLYNRGVNISDLENLMKENPINIDLPFRSSDALASAPETTDISRNYYEIKSFKETNMENSLGMYKNGAIGSYYETLDAGTGRKNGKHVTVRTILEEMLTEGYIGDRQAVFDPYLEVDGKLADDYNSQHLHQVTSRGTYNQFQSYHDESILLDENNQPFESQLKVKSKIIRQLLKRNTLDISMEGTPFIEAKITVGMKLRLLFLNSEVEDDASDARGLIDDRRSGDYVILALKHDFQTNNTHEVSLRVSKLSDLPANFELEKQ